MSRPTVPPQQRGRESPLLIVSASGRALASSAARGGLSVVVLDLFNDMDTRVLATASRACATKRFGLDAAKLLRAARELCPPERCAGIVYGSALESRPQLIARLSRDRVLYGNPPDIVSFVKDPVRFFDLLHRLDIAHPDVRMDAPPGSESWLRKSIGAGGGGHIRYAGKRPRAAAGHYFQRVAPGRAMSVLFLANGKAVRIVGFNEQWPAHVSARRPFLYGGAASRAPISPRARRTLELAVHRLSAALGLRGLNGLDFVLDGDRACVLELNPRPTATLDLYDADTEGGLLAAHIAACHGELPELRAASGSRAHAILYANDRLRIPLAMQWPAWCTDLPEPGSVIPAGAPVCSVHAHAATSSAARNLALARRRDIGHVFWKRAA